jgi:hypothetical protein
MSDSLPEAEYLEELKRLKKQALELCVEAKALQAEQKPESLLRELDLKDLVADLEMLGRQRGKYTSAPRSFWRCGAIPSTAETSMNGTPETARPRS